MAFLFSAECFCLSEFILIITKNSMTHIRIHIVPHTILLCVNLDIPDSEWGCDWESFRMAGAWRIWAESQWNLFISNQVSIFLCLQTLSCSFILCFPWWLFCLDFCCKKQINTWNFVMLTWPGSVAVQGGMLGREGGCCLCWLQPGEWSVKWRDSCPQVFFSSYFGLKNLVWVGSQPHSCCTDFCAVLMSVN